MVGFHVPPLFGRYRARHPAQTQPSYIIGKLEEKNEIQQIINKKEV